MAHQNFWFENKPSGNPVPTLPNASDGLLYSIVDDDCLLPPDVVCGSRHIQREFGFVPAGLVSCPEGSF
jgi:hypothetical protein